MASVGDRSHHGGGPISPRPAGSGSHGLRRCSVAAHERRRELGWGRRPGRTGVSARQLRASGASGAHAGPAGEFPFPRARPAHHPHPDTCDHRQLPSAETGTSWKRTWTPASFPQSEPADGEADGQTARQGPGPGDGARPRRRRTRAPPAPLPAEPAKPPSPAARREDGARLPTWCQPPGGAPSSRRTVPVLADLRCRPPAPQQGTLGPEPWESSSCRTESQPGQGAEGGVGEQRGAPQPGKRGLSRSGWTPPPGATGTQPLRGEGLREGVTAPGRSSRPQNAPRGPSAQGSGPALGVGGRGTTARRLRPHRPPARRGA